MAISCHEILKSSHIVGFSISSGQVGFAVLPGALLPLEVEALLQELPYLVEGGAVRMEQQSATSRYVPIGVLCLMYNNVHLSKTHMSFGFIWSYLECLNMLFFTQMISADYISTVIAGIRDCLSNL